MRKTFANLLGQFLELSIVVLLGTLFVGWIGFLVAGGRWLFVGNWCWWWFSIPVVVVAVFGLLTASWYNWHYGGPDPFETH